MYVYIVFCISIRVEIALQQNEIMDIFPDDYLSLADDDGIMMNKTDNTLKVCWIEHTKTQKCTSLVHLQCTLTTVHVYMYMYMYVHYFRNTSRSLTLSSAKTSLLPGLTGILPLKVGDLDQYFHAHCMISLCHQGIIAVSCGQPYSYDERVEISFKIMHSSSLVLIWSFADPIHPQVVISMTSFPLSCIDKSLMVMILSVALSWSTWRYPMFQIQSFKP